MKNGILIGLDVGTTVLKAAAFDVRTGRALAVSSRRLPVRVGSGGEREQSTALLDRAMRAAFADLRDRVGRRWREVAGIGLAAQGGSGIVVNRRTGTALTPMMLWNDARPSAYAARIMAGRPPGYWRRHTMRDVPGQGLGRMLWLRDTHPRLLTDDNLHVGAGEYGYFRLTGVWRQDGGNALQVGCFNARQRRLDQRLLDVTGLPLSFIAPMRSGHEMHGLTRGAAQRFGLPEGTPVAGPYIDQEAGYMSALGVSARPLQCSLGTAWVGNFELAATETWTSPYQLVLPGITGEGWLVLQPLLTGNVTWDWGLTHLADADQRLALRQADRIFASELLPPAGLLALPWFNAGNPLCQGALGGGAFVGMSPHTDRAQLLRALALGMACEMARVLAEVRLKRKVDSVVLGGGASRGRYFQDLFAVLFHPLPVYRLQDEDLAGARGVLLGFDRAVARARPERVSASVGAVRSRIEAAYGLYLRAFERMYGSVATGNGVKFQ